MTVSLLKACASKWKQLLTVRSEKQRTAEKSPIPHLSYDIYLEPRTLPSPRPDKETQGNPHPFAGLLVSFSTSKAASRPDFCLERFLQLAIVLMPVSHEILLALTTSLLSMVFKCSLVQHYTHTSLFSEPSAILITIPRQSSRMTSCYCRYSLSDHCFSRLAGSLLACGFSGGSQGRIPGWCGGLGIPEC